MLPDVAPAANRNQKGCRLVRPLSLRQGMARGYSHAPEFVDGAPNTARGMDDYIGLPETCLLFFLFSNARSQVGQNCSRQSTQLSPQLTGRGSSGRQLLLA